MMRSSWTGWESIVHETRSRTPSFDEKEPSVQQTSFHTCDRCGDVHACKTPARSQKPKWEKILHRRQPYEDNYVDESFLSSITNAHFQISNYRSLAFDTLVISQQVSIVVLFLFLFYKFISGLMTVRFLITIDALLIFLGFGFRMLLEEDIDIQMDQLRVLAELIASNIKRLFLFVSILLALSPVLKTLTSSFSSDTIYALTIIFCAIHLFLYDYSYVNTPHITTNFQGTISLNASIFASVLLASRLPSSVHVFAIVLCSFEVFAGFPIVARSIKSFSNELHLMFSLLVIVITLVSLVQLSYTLAIAYTASMVFISIICPFWLKWIQRYKNAIQGPWDYDTENEVPGE